jgi:hypothetical protein
MRSVVGVAVVAFVALGACGDGASCGEGGELYNDGEHWTCVDGCSDCWCDDGLVVSTPLSCDAGTTARDGG